MVVFPTSANQFLSNYNLWTPSYISSVIKGVNIDFGPGISEFICKIYSFIGIKIRKIKLFGKERKKKNSLKLNYLQL